MTEETAFTHYSAYGLVIASTLPLPELHRHIIAPCPADVAISLDADDAAPQEPPADARRIGPFLWATRETFWFAVPGIARFRIVGGHAVDVRVDPAGDLAGVRTFLLGTALGVVLAQRGHLMLHGNAVRVGDGCIVCLGPSGAGKSTLAAGFVRRGHALLADDLVMVDDALRVTPGVPRIKLWADAARAMAIDTAPLRRIRPAIEKFSYPVADGFAPQAVPVRSVYLLAPTNADHVSIRPVTGFDKFRTVHENTYRPQFIEVMGLRARTLALCTALTAAVPVARVERPTGGFALDALIDAILADAGTPR